MFFIERVCPNFETTMSKIVFLTFRMARKGRKAKSHRLTLKTIKSKEKTQSHGARGILNRWKKDNMASAMDEHVRMIGRPNSLSIHALARTWQVPFSTLRDRLVGKTKSIESSSGVKPVFDSQTEKNLATYIKNMAKRGFGLDRKKLRKLAYDYAERNNIKHRFNRNSGMAGYDWLQGFMKRHPDIAARKPESLSLARARGMNKPMVCKFFEDLQQCLHDEDILNEPNHMFNADETGLMDSWTADEVLGSTQGRVAQLTPKEKGQTTTVLGCANAAGQRGPLLYIFKGKRVKLEWQSHVDIWDEVVVSDNGWINTELMTNYAKKFVKFVDKLRKDGDINPDKKVILILDGHLTHTCSSMSSWKYYGKTTSLLGYFHRIQLTTYNRLIKIFFRDLKMNGKKQALNMFGSMVAVVLEKWSYWI
jgi:hypothetical protein